MYWNSVCKLQYLEIHKTDENSLAMAEMTTLTAAIYRIYRTKVKAGTEDTSPGITSRFEVFYDETKPRMKVCSLPSQTGLFELTYPDRSTSAGLILRSR